MQNRQAVKVKFMMLKADSLELRAALLGEEDCIELATCIERAIESIENALIDKGFEV